MHLGGCIWLWDLVLYVSVGYVFWVPATGKVPKNQQEHVSKWKSYVTLDASEEAESLTDEFQSPRLSFEIFIKNIERLGSEGTSEII